MGKLWEGCCQRGLGVHPAVSLAWLQDCGVPSSPDYGPRPGPESCPRVLPSGAAGGFLMCIWGKDVESPNSLQP